MTPVEHLNPQGMHRNPAFSQGVAVSGPHRTVYIGGQNAVDAAGNIVGDDIETQTRQVFVNLKLALAAAGADLGHIVKWNVYILAGQPLAPGFAVAREEWGTRPNPPAITGLFVAALAHPAFLVEMDAIAVVPE
ncbi:MAG: RidA family protein [Dehalococcoidia bacterium]